MSSNETNSHRAARTLQANSGLSYQQSRQALADLADPKVEFAGQGLGTTEYTFGVAGIGLTIAFIGDQKSEWPGIFVIGNQDHSDLCVDGAIEWSGAGGPETNAKAAVAQVRDQLLALIGVAISRNQAVS